LEHKAIAEQIHGQSDTVKQNPAEDEFDQQIRDILVELPEKARSAVILRYMDGFSYASAAEFLGIEIGTFKKRLHDGRRLLQKQIVRMAERTLQQHKLPRDFAQRCLCGCKQSSSKKSLKL
jgi:DNA-directed RNA polymerase specialized sigma24 family protein